MNAPVGRERTNRLRAIPLTDILRAADARPDPHDPAKWHTRRGTLSVNGAKFFNWNEATGGGGAIDLAMHLQGLVFRQAIDWLAQRFAVPSEDVAASSQTPRPLVLPVPDPEAWSTIIRYLNGPRRLPMAALQTLHASDDLYADHRHNAVLLLRNERNEPVGAELRGTGPLTWRGMAPGSRKDNGYFALGPPHPKTIVLCESAIDAISCHSLSPDRLCISTSGARDNPAWMPALLARGLPVYCGFDADETGECMAQTMIARHPTVQRLRPTCHDWNDVLRIQP